MVINYNGDVLPCCAYRIDMVNDCDKNAEKIRLGNIFSQDFMDIWNSDKYKMARKFVRQPSLLNQNEHYKDFFCYGCNVLCEKI